MMITPFIYSFTFWNKNDGLRGKGFIGLEPPPSLGKVLPHSEWVFFRPATETETTFENRIYEILNRILKLSPTHTYDDTAIDDK